MKTQRRFSIVLRLVFAMAATMLVASWALAADQEEKILHYGSLGSRQAPSVASASASKAGLSNGTGDGSLTITVDAYGSFGSSTPAGNAFYDPIGPFAQAGTTYESGLFFGPLGNFLTTDTFGAALPAIPFTSLAPRFAVSEFDVAGFHIRLTQELSPVGPGGSTFSQTYEIRNDTGGSRTFDVVRHIDGDLFFVGSFNNDFGGVSPDGRTLFEFDTGDNPLAPTTFVGITTSGGTPGAYTIQPFRFTGDIIGAGGIPSGVRNQIFGDNNGDRITDSGYDVTLSLQDTLSTGAGQTLTYITRTIFGQGAPAELGFEIVDPNNLNTGSPKLVTAQGEITTDTSKLLNARGPEVKGVVADGVTQLLLKVEADESTSEVTFSVDGGSLADGGLKAIGSSASLETSLPVQVRSAGGKRWAFAVYISPTNFSATATAQPDREIKLLAQAGATAATPKPLKLKRPPVALVHGVWSDKEAWKGLEDYLVNNDYLARHLDPVESKFARDVILRVNYGGETDCPNAYGAGSFDPSANEEEDRKVVKALMAKNDELIEELRKRGIAGTQVDIVAHSMGGLVARSRVKANFDAEPYYRRANFNRGDFHKLITVGTPHKGTPFADHVIRYRNEKLLGTCSPGPGLTGSVPCCETQGARTLEDFLLANGKALGPAVFGFQTASTALKNLGATPVPSHAIVGIAPNCTGAPVLGRCSVAERWLNNQLDNLCTADAHTTVGDLLGNDGNHDTIVPTLSQSGGLSDQATTRITGLVHASGAGASGVGKGETASEDVWREVTRLLRAPIDTQTFGHFSALTQDSSPSWQGCRSTAQQNADGASMTLAQANSGVTPEITISPLPGTIVRPGETIQIAFNVTPGDLLTNGAFFFVGDELFFTEGAVPFLLSYTVPTNHAGKLRIFADAKHHWTNTYVLVQPADPPLSLSVSPDSVEFGYLGVPRALRVLGQYANGLELDLTSADTGTTYATLSGGNSVVSVSRNGVLEARSDGQDTILVANSGRTAAGLVRVRITNHAPVFDPLNDLNLRAGESHELNVAVNDADGNAIALSVAVLPPFAEFADLGAGSGRLRLTPGFADVGAHRATLVAVDDGDPNLGSSRTILITVAPPAVNVTIVSQILNTNIDRQTGLFYQQVVVTNSGSATISGFRLSVSNLPAGARCVSATGTNAGVAFVEFSGSLAPGQTLTFNLAYYSSTRRAPVGVGVSVEAVTVVAPPPSSGQALAIRRAFLRPDGKFAVEFDTLAGRAYVVEYSSDMTTWKQAQPPVLGTGYRFMWVDSGPPQTESPPNSGPRFYRLVLLPQ